MRFAECKSWVWRANLHACYLKREYVEAESHIPCDDCVAYTPSGDHALHWRKHETVPPSRRYQEGSKVIAKELATVQCTYRAGYDQSPAYDLLPKPLYVDDAFHCCNACAEHECMSPFGSVVQLTEVMVQCVSLGCGIRNRVNAI